MILSVVSGTYNRIAYLKRMVASVRLSIGIGILYEIILVDGGSTDGTLVWARMQEDIKLIEQGELLGAVKAFQAGFEAANGKYVIPANDDIEFIDEALRCALSFMEDNAAVGIGCFYQDRYGKDWHVEHMSAVRNGKQVSVPYGQVCIIPKWLGDKVGWWDPGVGYNTYAGDNELSCNVYELGYDVRAIPCACIHDAVANDELRAKNGQGSQTVAHPDSAKWVKKWTRNGLLGPALNTKLIARDNYQRQQRILYAPIYEKGHTLQHKTKFGLREAFNRAGYLITEVDYIDNPMLIFDVANAFKPDVILTQFHDASIFNVGLIRELKEENPLSILVNWNGDYFPEHFFNRSYMDMLKLYNMATFVTPDVCTRYDAANIPWMYWQIGFETSSAIPDNSTKHHDVVFLGNSHYNFRVRLGQVLRSLRDVNVGLYGSWPSKFRPDGHNMYNYDTGQQIYKAAKIAISDGRPGATFVSNRIFQAMYAGCFTIQQSFKGITDLLGYNDGVHFALYEKTEELPTLIDYWLQHDKERMEIANTGMLYTLKYHSFDARVKQFTAMLDTINVVHEYATV